MLSVRPAAYPTNVWYVSDGPADVEDGHLVIADPESIEELVVFLKSVKPRRIVVITDNDEFYAEIFGAFTPDKVMRATR